MSHNIESLMIFWIQEIVGEEWTVSGDKPKDQTQFVLVDRTGGPRESMVMDRAEILIEVYHKTSRAAASAMADIIADSIPELLETESITRARVNSVVNLDDVLAQYHRYQIYVDVSNRR